MVHYERLARSWARGIREHSWTLWIELLFPPFLFLLFCGTAVKPYRTICVNENTVIYNGRNDFMSKLYRFKLTTNINFDLLFVQRFDVNNEVP